MRREYRKIREVARELGVHPDTIRRMIGRGEIKTMRVGQRVIRIPQVELDRLKRGNVVSGN